MIKNILFDLDDTLLDFRRAEREAIKGTLERFGAAPNESMIKRYGEVNLSQWKRLEKGELTRDEVKLRRFEIFFEETGLDIPAEKAAALYESLLGEGHYFVDGAEEVLKSLEDFRLYIVSNGSARVQQRRLADAGIEKYFDGIFISELIGFNKPDAGFFEYCFKYISDFTRDNTVIVGDSLSSDIRGGKNAGIKTVWFNPERKVNDTDAAPDYELFSLYDLTEILKTL